MWLAVIFAAIIFYYMHQLEKRIHSLEEVHGPFFSFSLSISAINAVINHKRFAAITGIKSAGEGKPFRDWSEEEKKDWFKNWVDQTKKSNVHLSYLAGEDSYFISNGFDNSYISHRSWNQDSLLYSSIVLGDKDGFEQGLTFSIYERRKKTIDGKSAWFLTPCLEYQSSWLPSKRSEKSLDVLCEFPVFREVDDDILKGMGFEIERHGGDDTFTNLFGNTEVSETDVRFRKNGAEITYVY